MSEIQVDLNKVPKHIAIIMDGNGRWAKSQGFSRTQGHIEGVRRVEEMIEKAPLLGIEMLTLFTFSTENWNRPKSEVNMLIKMVSTVLLQKVNKLHENNVRFGFIGKREGIPQELWNNIDRVIAETKKNTGMQLNMAFNYGARVEIIDAVREIAHEVLAGDLLPENIDESVFGAHLYTKFLPDPDLLIRTSGEKRISNFLLWQLSYAEFYFTEKFWPEFGEAELKKALVEYQNRERRFGNLVEVESSNE